MTLDDDSTPPRAGSATLDPLDRYGLLDGPTGREVQDVVRLAAKVCGTSMALMTVVDGDRQYFRARYGVEQEEWSIDEGYCPTVVRTGVPLVVGDTSKHPDFMDDPATKAGVAFYAGVPLATADGRAFGALCVLDGRPRSPDEDVVATLEAFARQVMANLELRYALRREREREEGLTRLAADLERQVADRTKERDRLWNLSRVPFLVMDSERTWRSVNPIWTEILGWEASELVGNTGAWLTHPDDRDAIRRDVEEFVRDGGYRKGYEMRLRAKDGGYRWFSWTTVAEGGLHYCVAVDVTDEKALVQEQARLQDQLRQSQKMEAVGQLTGGLAHDFNNLLTGMTGSLDLLKARIAQGRVAEAGRYLDAAQNAATKAAALTHRLLAFSRRQTLEPTPTDVLGLVNGMLDLVGRTVGPEIDVGVVSDGGQWETLVDRGQLENALLNLCINARDAMPAGGRITIAVANEVVVEPPATEDDVDCGDYVGLSVADEGTGMSPDVAARIFEPFFTTKPQGVGTGLGLSMAYGFAMQSGGRIRVRSVVGVGTTMRILLPRHRGARSDPVEDRAPRRDLRGDGRTVMVVDDDETIRMLVKDLLEDLGYATMEAGDGAAALRVLRSDARIDLLVTDVGLPGGMNGRQVAEAARVARPRLGVLFITGYAEAAFPGNAGLDQGMHVMTKPFSMDDLSVRIASLVALDGS